MNKARKTIAVLLCCALAFAGAAALSACGPVSHTVTFDLNYTDASGAPEAQKVEEGGTAVRPADPVRDGYDFDGWFTDKACEDEYDFSEVVVSDVTLYAGWTEDSGEVIPPAAEGEYIMEAEDIELGYVQGGSSSGNPSGANIILESDSASGGRYLSYLYIDQLYLVWDFTSDRAVADATVTFRFGGEFAAFSFDDDEIQIYVNPTLDDDYFPTDESERLRFDPISIPISGAFAEYEISADVSLKEGDNMISFLVNNTDSAELVPTAATMTAKAPTIDYLKITTSATLEQIVYDN